MTPQEIESIMIELSSIALKALESGVKSGKIIDEVRFAIEEFENEYGDDPSEFND